jgi:uncharacterized protein YxeA
MTRLLKLNGKKICPLEVFNIRKTQKEDKTMGTKRLIILAVALMVITSFLTVSFAEAGRVRGYYRQDGTYVQPHYRTNPDGNPYNNYSFPGNYNPNTGKITPGNSDTYLERHHNHTYQRSYRPHNHFQW